MDSLQMHSFHHKMFGVAITFIVLLKAVSALPAEYKILEHDRAEEMEREFQGDMVISQAELDAFNGRIDETLRWKNNKVAYWINMTYFDNAQAAYINRAVDTINALHCLQLVNRTNEVDFIELSGDATGCSSMVGRRGGKQTIKLKPNVPGSGCFRLYTIVHEFIHAFGFHHMQSSYDRDAFVRIVWENITPGTEHNFALYGTDRLTHFGAPYDFGSVMHYSATSFSMNGQATIVPTQNLGGLVMGQRERLTDMDILRIKRMYGCAPMPHNDK